MGLKGDRSLGSLCCLVPSGRPKDLPMDRRQSLTSPSTIRAQDSASCRSGKLDIGNPKTFAARWSYCKSGGSGTSASLGDAFYRAESIGRLSDLYIIDFSTPSIVAMLKVLCMLEFLFQRASSRSILSSSQLSCNLESLRQRDSNARFKKKRVEPAPPSIGIPCQFFLTFSLYIP